MGSYLSKPITEKISVDESNDKLICGASYMQGWRVSQEDAHNTILDYDENSSFFAVYDGHGGHEVAKYCQQWLPQFIKETEAYKAGDVEKALIDGFLGFDVTLVKPEVIAILKEMAGEKDAEEDSTEDENMSHLYEEASQPIAEVLKKYKMDDATFKHLEDIQNAGKSPMITAKKCNQASASSSSASIVPADAEKDSSSLDPQPGTSSTSKREGPSGSTQIEVNGEEKVDKNAEDVSSNTTTEAKNTKEVEKVENKEDEVNGSDNRLKKSEEVASKSTIPEIKVTSADSSETTETNIGKNDEDKMNGDEESSNNKIEEVKKDASDSLVSETKVSTADDNSQTQNDDEDTPIRNGEVCRTALPNKSKGKSRMKRTSKPQLTIRPRRIVESQLYKKFCESEESEDTEDETFVGPDESSSDDEMSSLKCESEEDSSDADDEAEEEEEEGEEEDDDEVEAMNKFADNIKEEPGSDSGCTAVVAILKGCELYVANAGDSRCIICRNGKAIEMSYDHKPEDWSERTRIEFAGGKVTNDGRVNGGLNLSRAIGDHAYKQNKELTDREQMITALPDVRKHTINPAEDEFMVLACDGIWNFMNSQEVVDFVKANSDNKEKLSQICEEMFDHCLAPNTMGDGTGCDNMTAIIVRFTNTMKKRPMASLSPEAASEASGTKRQKTDEEKGNAA